MKWYDLECYKFSVIKPKWLDARLVAWLAGCKPSYLIRGKPFKEKVFWFRKLGLKDFLRLWRFERLLYLEKKRKSK